MPINLDSLVIHIIINIIVISPFLWLSGRILVGHDKAKFSDSILIVVIGTVVGAIFGAFFTGTLALLIQFVLWLFLVKHFFDCGWLKALVISIFAVVLFAIILVALALIGIGLFHLL